MEDTDKLLKTAINLHYHDRPNVVAEAMHLIQEYLKEQTDSEYDKVLKTLHDLMNDLPSNILIYFLTTVPLPKEKGGSNSTFSELMKKSRVPLIENMQSVLTEYLNNAMPPLVAIDVEEADVSNVESEDVSEKKDDEDRYSDYETKLSSSERKRSNDNNADSIELPPLKKTNREGSDVIDIITDSCKSLLDICAEYVVLNVKELHQFYCDKNEAVWKLVNLNVYSGDKQTQCYNLIEDINKKLKWLRMIEAGHISVDVIREQYGDSEIFLKERHLYNLVDEDAFTVCKELREAIEKFVSD